LKLFSPEIYSGTEVSVNYGNKTSNFFVCDQPCKMFKRAVISPFGIIRETAGRKLPAFQMITDTFTADSLTRTRIIAAIT